MILNWVVGENETADRFEIEKSTDGKTFIMAALVFGTEKPKTDKYQFYEKAGRKKVLEKFSWESIAKITFNYYQEVIARFEKEKA